jgi:hypothetical protein
MNLVAGAMIESGPSTDAGPLLFAMFGVSKSARRPSRPEQQLGKYEREFDDMKADMVFSAAPDSSPESLFFDFRGLPFALHIYDRSTLHETTAAMSGRPNTDRTAVTYVVDMDNNGNYIGRVIVPGFVAFGFNEVVKCRADLEVDEGKFVRATYGRNPLSTEPDTGSQQVTQAAFGGDILHAFSHGSARRYAQLALALAAAEGLMQETEGYTS